MPTLLEFGRKWVWQLINNIYIREMERVVEFVPDSLHHLMTAPRHARRYYNWRWICTAKTSYEQYNCSFNYGKTNKHIAYAPKDCEYAVIIMFSMF